MEGLSTYIEHMHTKSIVPDRQFLNKIKFGIYSIQTYMLYHQFKQT